VHLVFEATPDVNELDPKYCSDHIKKTIINLRKSTSAQKTTVKIIHFYRSKISRSGCDTAHCAGAQARRWCNTKKASIAAAGPIPSVQECQSSVEHGGKMAGDQKLSLLYCLLQSNIMSAGYTLMTFFGRWWRMLMRGRGATRCRCDAGKIAPCMRQPDHRDRSRVGRALTDGARPVAGTAHFGNMNHVATQ
jgi:hypothetical protein